MKRLSILLLLSLMLIVGLPVKGVEGDVEDAGFSEAFAIRKVAHEIDSEDVGKSVEARLRTSKVREEVFAVDFGVFDEQAPKQVKLIRKSLPKWVEATTATSDDFEAKPSAPRVGVGSLSEEKMRSL